MKDEAITGAPMEVITIPFHCEAFFRRNAEKCKSCKIVMSREGQIQSSYILFDDSILLEVWLPLSTLASLIGNSKYLPVLIIQNYVHIEELTLPQHVTEPRAPGLFLLWKVIHCIQTQLPKKLY